MFEVKQVALGANKGSPRVWLEGRSLLAAGFETGAAFNVREDAGGLILETSDLGSYKVSGKGIDKPIIDLNSHKLLDRFTGQNVLRVCFGNGRIFISMKAAAKRAIRRIARTARNVSLGIVTTASFAAGGGIMAAAMDSGLNSSGLDVQALAFNEIRDELVDHAVSVNKAAACDSLFSVGIQEVAFDPALLARVPEVDILEMGLPCSGASPAGKTANKIAIAENHPHVGHLVAAAIAIIAKANPTVFVLENVPAYAKTGSAAILRNQLGEWGYQIKEGDLLGTDFGDLEARNRWVMVACSAGVNFDFAQLIKTPCTKIVSDILEPLNAVSDRWSAMEGRKAKAVRDKEAGKGFAMQIYAGSETKIATLTKGIAKNRSTDPKIQHPTDPGLLRVPTAAEHARCKGVPEALIQGLCQTTAHEVLGQGVCFGAMTALFVGIGESLQSADTKQRAMPVLGIAA